MKIDVMGNIEVQWNKFRMQGSQFELDYSGDPSVDLETDEDHLYHTKGKRERMNINLLKHHQVFSHPDLLNGSSTSG